LVHNSNSNNKPVLKRQKVEAVSWASSGISRAESLSWQSYSKRHDVTDPTRRKYLLHSWNYALSFVYNNSIIQLVSVKWTHWQIKFRTAQLYRARVDISRRLTQRWSLETTTFNWDLCWAAVPAYRLSMGTTSPPAPRLIKQQRKCSMCGPYHTRCMWSSGLMCIRNIG